MPFSGHDDYLAQVPPDQRAVLADLRRRTRALMPGLVEAISYNMPAFKLSGGKTVGGYAAFASHMSWFPHSGSVLRRIPEALAGYDWNAGTLRFTDANVPDDTLLRLLLDTRLAEIAAGKPR